MPCGLKCFNLQSKKMRTNKINGDQEMGAEQKEDQGRGGEMRSRRKLSVWMQMAQDRHAWKFVEVIRQQWRDRLRRK